MRKKDLLIMAVLLLFTASCYIASFFAQESCAWLSNVLISTACGFLTGLVLFFLTNRRMAKQEIIKLEYEMLLDIRNKAHELSSNAKYYQKYHSLYTEEIEYDNFFRKIIEGIYVVQEDLFSLPDVLFSELDIDVENTDFLDFDVFESAYHKIKNIEEETEKADKLLLDIAERMIQIEQKLRVPIKSKKEVLLSFRKHPF